jgi:hypothetical protein
MKHSRITRKSPLKRVSDKRAGWLKEYDSLKRKLGDEQRCERCMSAILIGVTGDWHHPAGRRTLEDLLTVIPLCRPCHDWVHAHASDAMAIGLLYPKYRKPTP